MEISLEARHFYKFLSKNNCLRQFIANVREQTSCHVEGWSILEILTRFSTVGTAFIWMYTDEGIQYWSDLSKKWNEERERRKSDDFFC
jgi:hypothetical protein